MLFLEASMEINKKVKYPHNEYCTFLAQTTAYEVSFTVASLFYSVSHKQMATIVNPEIQKIRENCWYPRVPLNEFDSI